MTEQHWDQTLNIDTCGRDDLLADAYRYPYEPTPYCVLERLAESRLIHPEDVVVDYGCGKGRVGFFLNWQIGCRSIGIEYDVRIFRQATQNLQRLSPAPDITFHCANAAKFRLTEGSCFYFFNPFSPEILTSVLGRIMEFYYTAPEAMKLFFYYPSDEYLSLLMTKNELTCIGEIQCGDLFGGCNPRERITVFQITALDL